MEKTLEYKPKHPDFDGTVKIKMKSYAERLRELAAAGLDKPETSENLEASVKMIEMVSDRIVSVDLNHASGVKFESVADLEYYEAGCELIQELAQVCVKGVGLGNLKKSRSSSK